MRHRPLTQYQYLFLVSTETDTSPWVTSLPMRAKGSFARSDILFRFLGGRAVVMRLINHHLFSLEKHIGEQQRGLDLRCACAWKGSLVGAPHGSLRPHHLVTFRLFVAGHELPHVIYLAPQALVSNLLIRFESLWKNMPCVLIAFGFVTE